CRELADLRAVLLLENRGYPQTERELDCLAGGASGRNDNEPPRRRLGRHEGRMVRRKIPIGYGSLHSPWKVHGSHRMRNGPGENPPRPSLFHQETQSPSW